MRRVVAAVYVAAFGHPVTAADDAASIRACVADGYIALCNNLDRCCGRVYLSMILRHIFLSSGGFMVMISIDPRRAHTQPASCLRLRTEVSRQRTFVDIEKHVAIEDVHLGKPPSHQMPRCVATDSAGDVETQEQ